MDIIATHLAKELLKRALIEETSLEWCIYGIEKRLSTFITWTFLILLGSYHFGFLQTISFSICFVSLRKYSNGYHAETYTHCLIFSLILQSASMTLVRNLYPEFFIIIWIFSDFVILKIAPVNNNQIHLTLSELSMLKRLVSYILILVNLTCVILILFPVSKGLSSVLKGLTAALVSDALTLVIFVLKNIYRRIFHENQCKKASENISRQND